MTGEPGDQSPEDRVAVILTPDQRVRVFISSTLEELAEERRRRGGRSGGCIWFLCGLSPAPGLIRRRACIGPTWSRVRFLSAFIGNGMAGWGRAWRSRGWRMSSGWPLVCRCCCT